MREPAGAKVGLLLKGVRHGLRALNEKFRPFGDPGMIEAEMVWDEIEEELHPFHVKALAKLFQTSFAAQRGRDFISGNGVRGAANIGIGPSGKDSIIVAAQAGILERF